MKRIRKHKPNLGDVLLAVQGNGKRLDVIEERLGKVENRLGKVEDRLGKLENRIDNIVTKNRLSE